jgi:flap endonuclease-1
MGIKQLMQLLTDKAPESICNITMEQLSGRVIACDASIAIY